MSSRLACSLLIALFAKGISAHAQAQTIDSFVDREAIIELLLETADVWNGGVDGQSGLGAYSPNWNGLFISDLSRSFEQTNPTAAQTVISQSRAIYFNVEAYRVATGAARDRYLSIVQKGADYLISHAWDNTFGGVYWGLEVDGTVPPSSSFKEAYGQVHCIFSLSHAYSITGDPDHLEFAWRVYQQFEDKHTDPDYPGAYQPSQSRNYSTRVAENNLDYMLHYFEALLALQDVTVGAEHLEVRNTLSNLGDFMTTTLTLAADSDTAYVSYWYDIDWGLHPITYDPSLLWTPSRFATAGHGIEFAWLISRAVERGYDASWLDAGRKLLTFARRYGINPNAGGMLFDILNTDGSIFRDDSPTVSMIWWPQAETVRALLHWAFLRDENVWTEFASSDALVRNNFFDPLYGGVFESFVVSNPSRSASAWQGQPDTTFKGSIWKVNYHTTMNLAEQIRLSSMQDPAVASSYTFTDYERQTQPAATGPNGDFDQDGIPNLMEYAMGTNTRYPNDAPYQFYYDDHHTKIFVEYQTSETAINTNVVVEWSQDLQNWSSTGIETEITGSNAQLAEFRGSITIDGGPRFARIRIVDEQNL